MATKRRRSSSHWEFVVKRKGVLPKPLYLTFTIKPKATPTLRGSKPCLMRASFPKRSNDSKEA